VEEGGGFILPDGAMSFTKTAMIRLLSLRSAVPLLGMLALAGCGEPTLPWQHVPSPGHRYTASAEFSAPNLDRNETMVFLESPQFFSRRRIYQAHGHDCIVLKWTAPRALTVEHIAGLPSVAVPTWQPLWGKDDTVTITYRQLDTAATPLPPMCILPR
jgi:hypothetical protein